MSDFFPLVSIIIPVYNGANFMRRAIDSALQQTYKNVEVIVINDGSNDGGKTEKIALSYGEKIRYFRKENGGVSSALNLGIKVMHGTYFSWLSHDDEYGPQKVELEIEQLRLHQEENLLVLCDARQINEQSEPIKELRNQNVFSDGQIVEWKEALYYLLRRACFCGGAFLIPKAVMEQCGPFHEGLRFSQDYLMWIEIFIAGHSFVHIDEVQYYSRIHDKQLTNVGQDIFHRDSEVVADVLLPKLLDISTKEDNFLYYFACYNGRYNNRIAADKCITSGKNKGLLSPMQELKVRLCCLYGVVRPAVRKIYYYFYKKT